MPYPLHQILVIDIEATCWAGKPPPGQENEIIEIGLCVLEPYTGNRVEKKSILVRPERSQVSEFCTKLTSLTQTQVDLGLSFQKACQILQDIYQSQNYVWASYGDYDRELFEKQCTARQIPYPFGATHLNIKTLCALTLGKYHEIGMSGALKAFHIPLEGTHHRGDDDAWNAARLLSVLIQKWQK